jgi:hypothetical protein
MKRNGAITHRGPHLLLLATVYLLLAIGGIAIAGALRHGAGYANPFGPIQAIQQFLASSPLSVKVAGMFLFASAIPLGIFTGTVVSQLRFLGVRAAGTYIALFGGLMASGSLVLSGLFTWTLSLPEVAAAAGTTRAIHFLAFLFGGVTFAVGFGLLAAGVSITSAFARKLPRWIVVLGLVIAIAGEFSTFSLIAYPFNFLIPIARFGGFVWLLAVGATLQRTREARMHSAAA